MSCPEVAVVVAAVRAALPLDREWSMMNAVSPPLEGVPALAGAPTSYLKMLRVANGFICGPVVLFDARTVAAMQIYAEPAAGSSIPLNPEDWYCVGVINDEPWFVKRSDESVWMFPDNGVTWWMSDRFEQVASGMDEFFLETICGPSCLSLAGAEKGDQWWNLLVHLNRVPRTEAGGAG